MMSRDTHFGTAKLVKTWRKQHWSHLLNK